jgi:transcriptional regulator with XRE-family HTH domain
VDVQDPRRILADRLRALREHGLPGGRKITQPELAALLGNAKPLSVPLISSWESQANPRIPPLPRLQRYAELFGAPRGLPLDQPRILSPGEMTEEEQRDVAELRKELTHLRNEAQRATAPGATLSPQAGQTEESLNTGPWRFADGNDITIVCAQWPQHMLDRMPYTDRDDPDYIDLLNYSELDALFELHGHVRAANPANRVNLRIAGALTSDDYTSHLASLGGVDWNTATTNALRRLQLPVRQIADWDTPDGQYFEVEVGDGEPVRHRAVLERISSNAMAPDGAPDRPGGSVQQSDVLVEDVALFARAISPWNRRRTVTICNGMYGRGSYGVVRALTDARFRDRNAAYLQSRFGDSDAYCILTRVPIVDGATLTPDWTTGEYTLFEWSA